jgi:CDGSH-type Zn-finger protein
MRGQEKQFKLRQEQKEQTHMADVTIHTTKNGPYIVEGRVELYDTAGNAIQSERTKIALCRCGASANKPFCDGTHSRIGFIGAQEAVEKTGE